jgi:hypothetical protein
MRLKRYTALLPVLGAAALLMAAVGVNTAQAKSPAPGYEAFAGCPSPEENPNIGACFVTTIKSGHFKMGSKDVPIEKPIKLSGGWDSSLKVTYNSKGGLSKVKQKVPGGVIGLTGLTWLAEFLGSDALTLYATTELAGAPSAPIEPPIKLPIKVHLENSTGVLGPNCYVGSSSNPISLNLVTELTSPPPPNQPIMGKNPEFTLDPTRPGVVLAKNGTFVDNSFAAPGASGCVLTLFGFIPISINGLVNSQSGLPSAAGNNETIQNGDTDLVETFWVYP